MITFTRLKLIGNRSEIRMALVFRKLNYDTERRLVERIKYFGGESGGNSFTYDESSINMNDHLIFGESIYDNEE